MRYTERKCGEMWQRGRGTWGHEERRGWLPVGVYLHLRQLLHPDKFKEEEMETTGVRTGRDPQTR